MNSSNIGKSIELADRSVPSAPNTPEKPLSRSFSGRTYSQITETENQSLSVFEKTEFQATAIPTSSPRPPLSSSSSYDSECDEPARTPIFASELATELSGSVPRELDFKRTPPQSRRPGGSTSSSYISSYTTSPDESGSDEPRPREASAFEIEMNRTREQHRLAGRSAAEEFRYFSMQTPPQSPSPGGSSSSSYSSSPDQSEPDDLRHKEVVSAFKREMNRIAEQDRLAGHSAADEERSDDERYGSIQTPPQYRLPISSTSFYIPPSDKSESDEHKESFESEIHTLEDTLEKCFFTLED